MDNPRLSDLTQVDVRLRSLALYAALMVVLPLFFLIAQRPENVLRSYVDVMLFAFSWPLLLFLALAAHRLAALNRLANRGVRIMGTVEGFQSPRLRFTRSGHQEAIVRFATATQERTVCVDVPSMDVSRGSKVTLLVDHPEQPRVGVILDVGTHAVL